MLLRGPAMSLTYAAAVSCSSSVHLFRRRPTTSAFATHHAMPARALSSIRAAKYTAIYSSQRILPLERPPDPSSLSNDDKLNANEMNYVQNQAQILADWLKNKKSVVCLTGAGMSTESGIPDYRGNKGSYFRGHKPIIHHEFMSSESQRKRYWARSLVGYSPFANAQPNLGHLALAKLEEMNMIGVELEECMHFDLLEGSCVGSLDGVNENRADEAKRRISIITQNVDNLHSKAGVQHCLHLHGRGDLVKCMNCGTTRDRKEYHDELTFHNEKWLNLATTNVETVAAESTKIKKEAELRPDGDAELGNVSYDELVLPSCTSCGTTNCDADMPRNSAINGNTQGAGNEPFFKTDVVFFGDSVPKHRFDISYAAVDDADGILCVGTSLAVHSAFRLVKRAIEQGTPVAILNVGDTRVEKEGLGADGLVTKLESPIGATLDEVVKMLKEIETHE